MTGSELIAEERARQVSGEGWSEENDDELADGELAVEAARWASEETYWATQENGLRGSDIHRKTKPRVRQLAIAGALIAAEIDRLLRRVSR